ncbi:hypothetical protein N8K70_03715 [Microbacterium betulae]|uniref:Uncharacterized protein n=1 Tax=Microbacterium betulae TaxID=2981139 RepID=A0AA97FLU0_9MICO|nr:hypothetical protein [Microbacterium sp. AB]WOF23797.1 hypothetical protein N8K70_03715 [Microbacterium sp. AB]
MTPDFPARFSDALVSEIKAEMGRQDLSSRALARLIGSNAQFVSSRLDGGNPRTGERVILTVRDLSAIAHALGLSELELVSRAQSVANSNVVPLRRVRTSTEDLAEVASESITINPDDTDDQY